MAEEQAPVGARPDKGRVSGVGVLAAGMLPPLAAGGLSFPDIEISVRFQIAVALVPVLPAGRFREFTRFA